MEVTTPPAKRIGVRAVIRETFSVYRQNAAALIGSATALFLVVVVAGLLQDAGGIVLGLISAVVQLVGYAIFVGFVVRLAQDARDGKRDHSASDLFSVATPALLPLIGFGILFGIGVGIGLLLLLVPGLVLLTFWSVGAPVIVIEEVGPIDAFGRSLRLVRGDAWPIFGALLVIFLIVLAAGLILAIGLFMAVLMMSGSLEGETPELEASIVSLIFSWTFTVLTAPLFALAASVIYFDLGGGVPAETAAA